MNDDIKNSTPDRGVSGNTVRGHLRTVATGDQLDEPATVDIAPDSMGGIDAAAMLRVDNGSHPGDAHEDEAPHEAPPSDTRSPDATQPETEEEDACSDEPEDDVLRYSDGSTVPSESPRRRLFRRRHRADKQQLLDALAATGVDVWAAHRSEISDETEAWDQLPRAPAAPYQEGSRHRRLVRLLALAAIVVVLIGIAASVLLSTGGMAHTGAHTPKRRSTTQSSRTRRVHTGTTIERSTARTTAKRAVRNHRHKHHVVKPVKSNASVTSPAPVTTPATGPTTRTVTQSTSNVPSTQLPTPPTTGTKTTTSSSTAGSPKKSSASTTADATGALPDVKQTEQQP